MFLLGNNFKGRIKWHRGQGIETEFFCFILPLLPVESLFVHQITKGKRTGIGMSLHWLSVVKTYLTWWPLPLALAWSLYTDKNPLLIVAGALISLLSHFFTGLPGKEEKRTRDYLQQEIELNALPQWLDSFNLQHIKAEALQTLQREKKDPFLNWQLVDPQKEEPKALRLLLVLTMYQHAIFPTSQTLYKQQEILRELNAQESGSFSSTGNPS